MDGSSHRGQKQTVVRDVRDILGSGVAAVDGDGGGRRWRVVAWLGWMERITVLIL